MPRPARRHIEHITLCNSSKGVWWGNPFDNPASYCGTVTSRWDDQSEAIASNHSSPTPYTRYIVERISETPSIVRFFNGHGGSNEVNYVNVDYISLGVTDIPYWAVSDGQVAKAGNAFARASTEVRNKFNDQSQVQTLAFAAEAKESASMLADFASQLWRAQLAARRRRWDEVAEILGLSRGGVLNGQFPHNRWLEYQYGWRPLVGDIHNMWLRNQSAVEKELLFKVHYTAKWDHHSTWGAHDNTSNAKGGCTAVVTAKLVNNLQHEMQQWGLINPAFVAWELVPFSFCIDWGIPVSNYLNSLTATAGLDFVEGYFSEIQETEWNIKTSQSTGGGVEVLDPGSFQFKHTFFKRSLMPGFPVPQLYGTDNPFNTTRIANAIALGAQLFSG